MSTVRITHRLGTGSVKSILQGEPLFRDMLRRGLLVETKAKHNLSDDPKRVDTGRLRSSINTNITRTALGPVVRIGTTVKYAMWVHEGTGVFGPRGSRIYPKRAKVLKWNPKGSSKPVFRRSVAGMRPNHFLRNALPAARG
jgi:hypothetical protein